MRKGRFNKVDSGYYYKKAINTHSYNRVFKKNIGSNLLFLVPTFGEIEVIEMDKKRMKIMFSGLPYIYFIFENNYILYILINISFEYISIKSLLLLSNHFYISNMIIIYNNDYLKIDNETIKIERVNLFNIFINCNILFNNYIIINYSSRNILINIDFMTIISNFYSSTRLLNLIVCNNKNNKIIFDKTHKYIYIIYGNIDDYIFFI